MSFTLKQLRYFVAVAEEGQITGASRRLNIAQPSLSAAIGQLEAELGVQLFLRHRARGLSPTPAGRRVLAEARGLLAEAEGLAARARGLGEALRGRLDVGSFPTFTPLHLPRLVADFMAEHPEVEIRLREGDQEALTRGLEDGRLDLALLYDLGLGADLALSPLAALPPYVLLPAGHPLAGKKSLRLADLAPEPMVLLDVPPSRDYFVSLFRRAGLEPLVRFHSPSFETVRSLVGNGVGYSILVTRPPGNLTYDGREVAIRPLADKVEPGRICLARPARTRPTRLSETFEQHCRVYFGGLGPAPRKSRQAAGRPR